eukprot:1581559-Rhodomonas_salina.1
MRSADTSKAKTKTLSRCAPAESVAGSKGSMGRGETSSEATCESGLVCGVHGGWETGSEGTWVSVSALTCAPLAQARRCPTTRVGYARKGGGGMGGKKEVSVSLAHRMRRGRQVERGVLQDGGAVPAVPRALGRGHGRTRACCLLPPHDW